MRNVMLFLLLLAILAPAVSALPPEPVNVDPGRYVHQADQPDPDDPCETAILMCGLCQNLHDVCTQLARAAYLICGGVATGQIWLGLESSTGGCHEVYRFDDPPVPVPPPLGPPGDG